MPAPGHNGARAHTPEAANHGTAASGRSFGYSGHVQRRRASAAVTLACLLISAGVNLGVVVASVSLLHRDAGPPSPPPQLTISHRYCGEVHRELADLVLTGPQALMLPLVRGEFEAVPQAATTPLYAGRLLLELGDVLFGPECEEAPMLVALVDPEVLPTDEETLDFKELELEAPEPKLAPKEKPKPEEELEEQPLPEPEPVPVPEPEPEKEKEKEKEKIDFTLEQLKMVEQLDEHDDDHSPDDAHYLSNINRDVLEETRAKMTNLIEDAEVPKAAQEEPSEEPEKGTANEENIAETQEQKSQLARLSPETKPEPKPQLKQENDPKPKSLLSMRDLPKRRHSAAMTEQDSLANAADDGSLDAERQAQAPVSARNEQRAKQRSKHATNKFRLSQRDLTAAFGKDVAAEKNLVSQRQSKQKGIWEEAREHWQSPLENMVPEVRPGNQTALRSRKHPFARYIATIHRTIHDLWAWGFLDQLDTRPRNHPLNNAKLWTRVEIVLLGNGKIDSIKTVRFSGNTGFDAAAREIVYASTPFPTPPRSILSGNGKVYIHWAFHRDARACGTFGAEPFILDNAGQGDRPDPSRPVRATSSERHADRSRRLSRQLPPSRSGPEGPTPPKARSQPKLAPTGPPPGAASGPAGIPSSPASADMQAANAAAKRSASGWLFDFAAANIGRLVARSSIPFYIGDQVIARNKDELEDVLKAMVEEAKGGRPKAPVIYSAAKLRKELGSVPAGVHEGSGRIFALTKISGDPVILMVEKRFGAWRVIGLAR